MKGFTIATILSLCVFFTLLQFTQTSFGMTDGSEERFAEVFKPREGLAGSATGYFLKDAASKTGAVCLDGTPSAYYHEPGTGSGANKWYIHHQGGGWCESLESCYGRSSTDLGSSKNYPASADLGGGYFSDSSTDNPQMYNWNKVYMRYCDGGSFSGNNASTTTVQDKTLYFRGFRILQAMVDDLLTNRGLDKATDAVISGCSAGGLATYLHVDYWAKRLGDKMKVRGMPDSGFFLDWESSKGYHTGMKWVFEYMNSTDGVNQACLAAHKSRGEQWKCIFAQHTSPYIVTPIFPLQSEYDTWQTANELGSTDPTAINDYGSVLTYLVKMQLLSNPIHGIFLDSCAHHCGEWNSITINGDRQPEGFQKWYEKGASSDTSYFQDKVYPCEDCCKPSK